MLATYFYLNQIKERMNLNKQLLSPQIMDQLSELANCKVSQIEVFAIPDTLAISFLFTTKKEAKEMYIDYSQKNGKEISNPASWQEFEGYPFRLLIFRNGYGVHETPYRKDRKFEIDAIREALEGNDNFEIKTI